MTPNEISIKDSFLQHGEEFRVLFGQLAERKNVHAYLICGEKGTGKRTLARLMGAALLCSAEGNRPCGCCRNCRLAESGEHPDLIRIEKGNPIAPGVKKDRSTIPVEDIREMIRICSVRPTDGSMHIVLICDADKMTVQAQNCLLKTLEEPPADTCIILITEHTESLLTTVISRCRTVRVRAWEDEYILSVLERNGAPKDRALEAAAAAGGSIGKALELVSDDEYWKLREEVLNQFLKSTSRSEVIKISNQWKDRKPDSEKLMTILESYVRQMTEYRFGAARTDLSRFPAQWQRFSEKAGKESFLRLSEALSDARKQLQFNTNYQAVLEKIIFAFMGEGNLWLSSSESVFR